MYDEQILAEMLDEMDDASLDQAISFTTQVIRAVVNDANTTDYPSALGCLRYVQALIHEKVKRDQKSGKSHPSVITGDRKAANSTDSEAKLAETIAKELLSLNEVIDHIEGDREFEQSLIKLTSAIDWLWEMVDRETVAGVIRIRPNLVVVGSEDFPGGTWIHLEEKPAVEE